MGRRSEEQACVREAHQRFPAEGVSAWDQPSFCADYHQFPGQLGRCHYLQPFLVWEGHHLPRARIGALILVSCITLHVLLINKMAQILVLHVFLIQ